MNKLVRGASRVVARSLASGSLRHARRWAGCGSIKQSFPKREDEAATFGYPRVRSF